MATVLSGIASSSRYTELRNQIHEIELEIDEKTKIPKAKTPCDSRAERKSWMRQSSG
jgi:hypothetical protein